MSAYNVASWPSFDSENHKNILSVHQKCKKQNNINQKKNMIHF